MMLEDHPIACDSGHQVLHRQYNSVNPAPAIVAQSHCTLATMANYEIEVSSTAEKQLRKLSPKDQISVLKRIQELGGEPRPNHSRKPWGQRDIYRVRAGNYRILYSIEENYLIIIILKVGQRRDVYR